MTRKEKQIYKSGRKNENAYHFSRLKKNQKKFLAVVVIILFLILSLFILDKTGVASVNEVKNYLGAIDGVRPVKSDFAVYYLDVGQSDCTIVVCNDEVLMIDCGTYNQVNTIRQSLKSLDVDSIDYMLVTHQHDDHIGGAVEILSDWDVKNFIMPMLSETNNVSSKTYNVLINTLSSDKNINKIPAQELNGFTLGDAYVEILSPSEQNSNINNMSVVLKITYGNTSFLFQGDAETKIENELLQSDFDLDIDVLKSGHHGSNTSSSEKFLSTVSPKVVIVSSGAENSYGHPNGNVLERFDQQEIPTVVTSLDGDITVTSDGNTITVYTQNSDDYIELK